MQKALLLLLPTGTFTLQDAPSFALRDNGENEKTQKPDQYLDSGKSGSAFVIYSIFLEKELESAYERWEELEDIFNQREN